MNVNVYFHNALILTKSFVPPPPRYVCTSARLAEANDNWEGVSSYCIFAVCSTNFFLNPVDYISKEIRRDELEKWISHLAL